MIIIDIILIAMFDMKLMIENMIYKHKFMVNKSVYQILKLKNEIISARSHFTPLF